MTFGEHLEELRSRLIRALLGVLAGTAICLCFSKHILAFVCAPVMVIFKRHGLPTNVLALSPQEPFFVWMKLGLLCGLVLAGPYALWQLWQFVSAGLYQHERRFVRLFAPVSLLLFALGVGFMYYIVYPVVLNFFVTFAGRFELGPIAPTWFQRVLFRDSQAGFTPTTQPLPEKIPLRSEDPASPAPGEMWFNTPTGELRVAIPVGEGKVQVVGISSRRVGRHSFVQSQFRLNELISFVIMLALAFGIAFQVPIVVVFLSLTRIASARTMGSARRYVLFMIVVAAALLTPPDVISQVLLAVPMYALFEGGLLAARLVERRRGEAIE